ncbi:hypothetical protein Tdes44962_MAKER09321 [Teratosphaeria destructans]|uniref:DUF7053 domain-containing protein n=1 Tax=Teratosphaeria destructans TaxID=418781 RepID=A0A9W7W364_9PEZI|nr:hypothetical protein Tdes44962_MAKER09321 [Teratosphaeria destructans]
MGKRIVYTKITPLPPNVPRQLALELLHSHDEMIRLNPLVTGVKSIEAPRDAASDEFFSQWYEISEIITWGFGLKKKISFKGVFHDQPWGLQSHVYAPMGVDMRNKYRIGGNQPGEPREARELGVDTPSDGLYLREDVDITCSVPLTAGFVAKEAKAATAVMIARLSKKAELLDEGKLHAMFENGRLKTSRPNMNPTFGERPLPSPMSAPGSPLPQIASATMSTSPFAPPTDDHGFGNYHDLMARKHSRRQSHSAPQQYFSLHGMHHAKSSTALKGVPEYNIAEVPGSFYHADPSMYPPTPKQGGHSFMSELPGDYPHSSLAPPPTQQTATDRRRSSQFSTYQASQQQGSPQPSPGLPCEASPHSGDSRYRLTNPDSVHLAYRQGSSSSVAEWQRSLPRPSAEDLTSPHHSGASSQHGERGGWPLPPDEHQEYQAYRPQESPGQRSSPSQFQQASSSQSSPSLDPARCSTTSSGSGGPQGTASTHTSFSQRTSHCPVCHFFEGDEAAIGHHVSKAHGFA